MFVVESSASRVAWAERMRGAAGGRPGEGRGAGCRACRQSGEYMRSVTRAGRDKNLRGAKQTYGSDERARPAADVTTGGRSHLDVLGDVGRVE